MDFATPPLYTWIFTTIVRRKSLLTAERNILIDKALLDIKAGIYKSLYAAEKALGLPKSSVERRANGYKTRAKARQLQQKLLAAQESVLLK